MGKDDPETAALKKELEDLINKCKVHYQFEFFPIWSTLLFIYLFVYIYST